MILKEKIFFIFLLTLFIFLVPSSVFASPDFETSYNFTYTVKTDASVEVLQEIGIKNMLSNIYVSEYTLVVGSNRVYNVGAWDDFGSLEPTIETGDNNTKIFLRFEDKVVGKGKENKIRIKYDTPDFALKKGQILEVNIPSLANKQDLTDYNVNLVVPSYFGSPSYIQPMPSNQVEADGHSTYYYKKANLLNSQGISAGFGDVQVFDFTFNYYLHNDNKFPGRTEIALPADTAYQRVFYQSIEPPPLSIRVDEDQNWLAMYRLEGEEKLMVTATGSAEIYVDPQNELKEKPLTDEQINMYLEPKKYWEVDDSEIKKLAQKLQTPEKIYRHVATNLIYDYGRLNSNIQRFGAKQILQNQQSALCTEFADLFIAISRAAGIPAREVDGFAYTTNPQLRPLSLSQDVLHAWAEYYDKDKQLWIPVDPTWDSTTGGVDFFHKLDLNHFSFVRHGVQSDFPHPAGAYSLNEETKSVFVDFGEKKDHIVSAKVQADLPQDDIAGLSIDGKIQVINTGETAFHNKQLVINSNGFNQTYNVEVLPPKGTFEVPVSIKTNWRKAGIRDIEVQFADQKSTFTIEILPIYQFLPKKIYIVLLNLPSIIVGQLNQISLPI